MTDSLSARRIALKTAAAHITARRAGVPAANLPRLSALDSQARPFAQLLIQNLLKHYFPLRACLSLLVDKMPKRPFAEAVLLGGLCELIILQKPEFAAVHSYVELGKNHTHAGFINAVLRRAVSQREALQKIIDTHSPAPDWLDLRWQKNFGKAYSDTIASLKAVPTLGITVKSDAPHWVKQFTQAGYQASPLWRNHIRVQFSGMIAEMPGFAQGQWWVQDFASYLVTQLFVQPIADKTLLDIGAAPGGKSANFAREGARLTCLDISKKRMARFEQNFTRLNLNGETVIADALTLDWPHRFELIMLDAPCSAMGTVRHNPDILLHRRFEDIIACQTKQRALLEKSWAWLEPGGMLIYAVCSLEPEEGAALIAEFLEKTPDAMLKPIDAQNLPKGVHAGLQTGMLYLYPHLMGGIDGFFTARLTKQH